MKLLNWLYSLFIKPSPNLWRSSPEKISKYWFGAVNIALDIRDWDNVETLFGPVTKDEREKEKWFSLKNYTTFAALFRDIGIFESASEASRNGWNKPIENGWHKITFKRGLIVYIQKDSSIPM